MKKLMLLFLFLVACEKDETFCWNCRKDVYAPGGYYSVVVQVCGMSESEIKQFEKDNSLLQGVTTIEMTCWKKGEPAPTD